MKKCFFLSVFTILSCFFVFPVQAKISNHEKAGQMYTRIAERIQKDYVEESTPQELLEGALKGLLNSLDPHSTFLSVNKMKALRQNISGRFGGVGIEITMKDSLPLIVAPIDDSPAKEKDLRPGDFIIMIDEKPIGEKDINDIVDQLRGDVGAPVTLTIRRKDTTPFDVTLNRAIIKVKPVKWRVEGGDMGYIRITNFSGNNTKLEIVKAIHAIQSKLKDTLKGFVLDMRNNAGGLLNQAVDVADIFLKSGEVVSTKGRRPEETKNYRTDDGEDISKGIPLVVLINAGSASASEIVAGALQHHGRALIVGTRSFGKGSVQTVFPLSDGSAVKMTTALYYTPSGRSIQKKGIIPDILVEQATNLSKLSDEKVPREEDLAISIGLRTPIPGDPLSDSLKGDIKDYQLLRALDIARAIYLHDVKRRNKTA